MTEILDYIYKRRSIRKFTEEPVDKATLELLLKAGMAAPSAMNRQPWEFVVLTQKETLDRVRAKLPFAHHNATAAIVVCGHPGMIKAVGGEFWVQDCSAAAQNILLAAAGMGLGGVWIGVEPVPPFIKRVREICGLPKDVNPLGIMMLGHPAEEKPPHTKYDPAKVHWEKY